MTESIASLFGSLNQAAADLHAAVRRGTPHDVYVFPSGNPSLEGGFLVRHKPPLSRGSLAVVEAIEEQEAQFRTLATRLLHRIGGVSPAGHQSLARCFGDEVVWVQQLVTTAVLEPNQSLPATVERVAETGGGLATQILTYVRSLQAVVRVRLTPFLAGDKAQLAGFRREAEGYCAFSEMVAAEAMRSGRLSPTVLKIWGQVDRHWVRAVAVMEADIPSDTRLPRLLDNLREGLSVVTRTHPVPEAPREHLLPAVGVIGKGMQRRHGIHVDLDKMRRFGEKVVERTFAVTEGVFAHAWERHGYGFKSPLGAGYTVGRIGLAMLAVGLGAILAFPSLQLPPWPPEGRPTRGGRVT